MKTAKRITSVFLVLVLVLSMLSTAAFAAGSDYSTRLLVEKTSTDTVDVKWMVQTSNGAVLKTTNSIIFKYDNTQYDMLTNDGTVITTKTMSDNLFSEYRDAETYTQNVTTLDTPALWGNSGIYTEAKGQWTFVLINLATGNATASKQYTTETALAVIHLKLKSGTVDEGLPGGSIALATKDEANGCSQSGIVIFIGADEEQFIYGNTSGATDTLPTTPVVAAGTGVTFAKPAYSGTVDAPTVSKNTGGNVELIAQAISGETVEYGYSTSNDASAVSNWQTGTTFSGLTVGTTYYFFTRVTETAEHQAKASTGTSVVPVAATLTSITISGDTTATVPTKDNTTTVNLTATGSYNDSTSSPVTDSATWSIDSTYDGVTVDKGVVTIQPSAAAGSVTIKAECGGQSNTHTITLSKATATLTKLTISGNDSVSVPGEYTYTASGEDQYGESISTGSVTWNIKGTAPTGVSIGSSNGKLSITNSAEAGSVTIKATSGAASDTKTVTITKAASVVDSVTISGGVSSLTVPTVDAIGGSKSENASTAFTAELKDQYGATISGTVTWSVSGNPGVTISGTGLLSITNEATDSNVTVKAECGSKSATQTVSVTPIGMARLSPPMETVVSISIVLRS